MGEAHGAAERQCYELAGNLICLERGGLLVLANGTRFVPFVITEGKNEVRQAVQRLSGTTGTVAELGSAFDPALLLTFASDKETPPVQKTPCLLHFWQSCPFLLTCKGQ